MTFKGDKIVGKPTFAMVEIYIAEQGLFCDAQDAFTYWENKGWLTKKGVEPKTLEIAIHVFNSIAVQREVKKQLGNINFKDKKEKQESCECYFVECRNVITEVK